MDLIEKGALLPTKQCIVLLAAGPQQTLEKSTSAKQAVALWQLPNDLYYAFQWQSGEQRGCYGLGLCAWDLRYLPHV